MRSRLVVLIALLCSAAATLVHALGPRQVRVSIEFEQSGSEDREVLEGGGGIVIRRQGGIGSSARIGGDSGTTKVRRSSGIFTIVQDGGDSMLSVAQRVPYEDVQFFRDYATGAGYLTRGVMFERVGTSLKVHADVLSDQRIRLRLVPSVSYFSADGSGAIDFTDAATEIVVESGKPVLLGGATTETEEVTRRILGYGASRTRSESSVLLRAVLQ